MMVNKYVETIGVGIGNHSKVTNEYRQVTINIDETKNK